MIEIKRGDDLPEFDVQTPLMSLPRIFKTDLNTIPGTTPYLSIDPGRINDWRDRLALLTGFRVGIVSNGYWATEPDDAAAWLAELGGLVQQLAISGDSYHGGVKQLRFARNACDAARECGSRIGRDNLEAARYGPQVVHHSAGRSGRSEHVFLWIRDV